RLGAPGPEAGPAPVSQHPGLRLRPLRGRTRLRPRAGRGLGRRYPGARPRQARRHHRHHPRLVADRRGTREPRARRPPCHQRDPQGGRRQGRARDSRLSRAPLAREEDRERRQRHPVRRRRVPPPGGRDPYRARIPGVHAGGGQSRPQRAEGEERPGGQGPPDRMNPTRDDEPPYSILERSRTMRTMAVPGALTTLALMLITVWGTTLPAGGQEPRQENLKQIMIHKLKHSQFLIEGLAMEDFALIRDHAGELKRIGEDSLKRISPNLTFVKYCAEFVSVADEL